MVLKGDLVRLQELSFPYKSFKFSPAAAACEAQTYFPSSLRRERSDDWKYLFASQATAAVVIEGVLASTTATAAKT